MPQMNALRQQINKSSVREENPDRPKRPASAGINLSALKSHSASNFDYRWQRRNHSATETSHKASVDGRKRADSQVSAVSGGSAQMASEVPLGCANGRDSTGSLGSASCHEHRNEAAVRRRLASFFFWETPSHSHTSSHPSREQSVDTDRESEDLTDLEPPPPPLATQSQSSTIPFPMLRSRSNYSGKNMSVGVSEANARKTNSNGPSTPTLFIDGSSESPSSRRRTEESASGPRSRSSSLGLNFGFGYRSSPSSASVARHSSSSDELKWRQELPLPPPPTAAFLVQRDADTSALGLDPAAVRYADHMHSLGYTRNKLVCALLAKESRDGVKFNSMVMQAYIIRMMRFAGEPLDMSLRKLLYRIALPQETQQIERVLQAFSILWHYENPGLFTDAEQVLFVVFSMVIVHTDMFNRSVKHKMAKADYLQYAYTEGVASEILEYFYDNITATAFREDDDFGMPLAPPSPNSGIIGANVVNGGIDPSPVQTVSDGLAPPVPSMPPLTEDSHSLSSRKSGSLSWARDLHPDPYPYLLENRLDALRPTLTSIVGESTCGTILLESDEELQDIEGHFARPSALIQVVSQRSRPDAYLDGNEDAVLQAQSRPGIVEIGVVKHGVVLRRESKKILAVTKPAWKEWGAVLTESRLYLFKNATFVKLMANSTDSTLRASMDTLNQATTFSTRDMAAVTRVRRANHEDKYEFMLVEGGRDSSHQQWLSVDSEEELKSWVQTINFAATQATFTVTLVSPVISAASTSQSAAGTPASSNSGTVPGSRKSSAASLLGTSISEQMEEVDRQLDAVEDQIAWYMRTFRHLRLLAPIQQRTREALVFAAGRYSSKCDAAFVKQARLQCYKNVLARACARATLNTA